jgi:hypothetical protein
MCVEIPGRPGMVMGENGYIVGHISVSPNVYPLRKSPVKNYHRPHTTTPVKIDATIMPVPKITEIPQKLSDNP